MVNIKRCYLFILLLGVACMPVGETAVSPTNAPNIEQPSEEAADTLTVASGLIGTALVSVPDGEKSWPTVQSFDDFVTDWSPNGRFLLFYSARDGKETSDLFLLDVETGEERRLTDNDLSDWDGRFSPDGSQVAYVSLVDSETYGRQLFVINSDGTEPRQLTHAEDNTRPNWSPNGEQLIVQRNGRLLLIDVATGDETPLGDWAGEQALVGWSPDGDAIAFISNHHRPQKGEFHLYRYDFDTGEAVSLVSELGNVAYGDWSGNGRYIAFTANGESNHPDSYQLYVYDFESGEATRLWEEDAAHVAWSPDGEWIAFSRTSMVGRDILIIRPDGSGTAPLTDGGEDEWGAVWSPDSTQIAFLSERVLSAAPPAAPVMQGDFTRIDLAADLRPRGVGHTHFAGSPVGGESLYLVEIASGERVKISDSGGWGDVVVQESAMYWIDSNGHVQEFRIDSGEARQITTVVAERRSLVGNGRFLAWADKRDESGEENYYAADIYVYDLLNDQEIAVAVAAGVQDHPAIGDNLLVWQDNRNSPVRGEGKEGCGNCDDNPFGIYSYDLLTGETAVLVEDGKHNAQPTISNGRVAWVTHGEGIRMMELERGVVETAVSFSQNFQEHFTNPHLEGTQLYYTVSWPCDVGHDGGEFGIYQYDIARGTKTQLTAEVEPFVHFSPSGILITEQCMGSVFGVQLLTDILPSSLANVGSNDPTVQLRDWLYHGANSADQIPPASDSVRVLDELHYEIRLVETASGFDLIWSNLPCSTQPALTIEPEKTLVFAVGDIVGEDCEAMGVGHRLSVTLMEPVPLTAWQFEFVAP